MEVGKMRNKSVPVIINCLCCGKEIHTTEYRVKRGQKYCSVECYDKAQVKRIHKECSNCNTPIDVIPSCNKEYNFCSQKCSHEFFLNKRRSETPIKNCEMCGTEYKVQKGLVEKSRFCSKKCLSDWQKTSFKGEGSCKFIEPVKLNCFWCDKEIERKPYRLKNNTAHFCSIECKDLYHKNIFMKTPESIERNRKNALKNLENQVFKTDSHPQILINNVLDELEVQYKNEFIVGNYSIDNYLPKQELFIEIMGGYWHCDSRTYSEINYKNQIDKIITDKRKRTYLKKHYNKNILYLWEMDIENNLLLCKILIKEFIDNKGVLKDYHSSSYMLEDTVLQVIKNKPKQYMHYKINELNEIVSLEVKEKRSQYQPEKHITFNCDQCNKETEQLLVQYVKAEKHFCSKECKKVFFNHGVRYTHNCANCEKEILLLEHRHSDVIENNRNVFCGRKCQGEWMSKNINREKNQIDKECLLCGSVFSVSNYRKDTAKFCSRECADTFKQNQKIVVNCTWCGTSVQKYPSQVSKNNFCSNACVGKYNGEQRKKRVKKNCVICNEEFETIPSREQTNITCSRECQGKWQSRFLIGENANNYKGREK